MRFRIPLERIKFIIAECRRWIIREESLATVETRIYFELFWFMLPWYFDAKYLLSMLVTLLLVSVILIKFVLFKLFAFLCSRREIFRVILSSSSQFFSIKILWHTKLRSYIRYSLSQHTPYLTTYNVHISVNKTHDNVALI